MKLNCAPASVSARGAPHGSAPQAGLRPQDLANRGRLLRDLANGAEGRGCGGEGGAGRCQHQILRLLLEEPGCLAASNWVQEPQYERRKGGQRLFGGRSDIEVQQKTFLLSKHLYPHFFSFQSHPRPAQKIFPMCSCAAPFSLGKSTLCQFLTKTNQ